MFRFVHGFRALLGVFLCLSRVVPPVLLEEDPLATQGPNNGICDDGKVSLKKQSTASLTSASQKHRLYINLCAIRSGRMLVTLRVGNAGETTSRSQR